MSRVCIVVLEEVEDEPSFPSRVSLDRASQHASDADTCGVKVRGVPSITLRWYLGVSEALMWSCKQHWLLSFYGTEKLKNKCYFAWKSIHLQGEGVNYITVIKIWEIQGLCCTNFHGFADKVCDCHGKFMFIWKTGTNSKFLFVCFIIPFLTSLFINRFG